MSLRAITFQYMNHRGITEERTIVPESIDFVPTGNYGYQPGWFISGICQKKLARRSFALSRIIFPEGTGKALSISLRFMENES